MQTKKTQNAMKQTLTEQQEKLMLLEQLKAERQSLNITQRKLLEQRQQYNKIMESNGRNSKRIMRMKAKMQQMHKYRNKPEYFIQVSGFMNQALQSFIISHNYQFQSIQTNDPDRMTYEQLLDLGDKIGKVSKGMSKQQFQRLKRVKVGSNFKQHCCCICQNEYSKGQEVVQLRCNHSYHQDCILQWFREEHHCPICKQESIEN